MTGAMKMLAISRAAENRGGESRNEYRMAGGRNGESRMGGNENRNENRNEYRMGGFEDRGEYRMESPRGNENRMGGYENRMGGFDDGMEMARRYRRDSRGRFMPRGEYGADDGYEPDGGYESMERGSPRSGYGARSEYEPPRRRIGFITEPVGEEYRQDASYNGADEMEHRHSPMAMGRAYGRPEKLSREMADEWMRGLKNEDDSTGPHWNFEQAKQVMAQKGVKAEPLEFYAVLNAMYADYCKVFKKYGVGDRMDFYVDMARAFIEDKDAVDGKVAAYFENVVKKS